MEVILAGVDEEHLKSAASDPRFAEPGALISFGTMLWEEPPTFPRDVPIYLYAVTRGLTESVPYATWRGTFRRYRRLEHFGSRAELDATRPQTTLDRRDHPDENEREPEWAGYLLVTDLEPLDPWVPFRNFTLSGKPSAGTVVRRPMVAELD
jgi:hypothetical protein